MSHVTKIPDVKIKDLDALGDAAAEVGMELDLSARTFAAFYEGTKGDRDNTCDVGALRVAGQPAPRAAGNKWERPFEVGVRTASDGDGYELRYDPWCEGNGLHKVTGSNLTKLRQAYSARVAEKALKRAGHRVSRTVTTDGRILLRAAVR